MAETFAISAQLRDDQGKGASRRLRRGGRLPGVVYGAGKAPAAITMNHNEVWIHLQNEAFHSHLLTLDIAGNAEQVVLRDVQLHPYKLQVLHIDLQRVSAGQKIHLRVPLHFVGEERSPVIKLGGAISHTVVEVEVTCLPEHLPEFIEVDVSGMEMDQILHYSDIVMPDGVTLLGHEDLPIVSMHATRTAQEPGEGEPAPAGTAEDKGAG